MFRLRSVIVWRFHFDKLSLESIFILKRLTNRHNPPNGVFIMMRFQPRPIFRLSADPAEADRARVGEHLF